MRTLLPVWLFALCLLPLAASPAAAQPVVRATLGGAGGLVAGTAASLGVVVARARFEHDYLHSSRDLLHWQSLPILLGPAAGVALGLASRDALVTAGAGAGAGLLLGAAGGAGLGALASDEPEWRWAGGVMGAGLGVTVGALAGALVAWAREDESPGIGRAAVRLGARIPL